MKSDRGTIFLTFTCLLSLVLIIMLAAAIVIGPPPSQVPDQDQGSSLGATASQPQPAQPIIKDQNYPGISKTYTMYGPQIGYAIGNYDDKPLYGTKLTLNDDGTLTLSCGIRSEGYAKTIATFTCGHWYKIKGQGHAIYFTIDGNYRVNDLLIQINKIGGSVNITNQFGQDYFTISDVEYTGGSYSGWDAGYSDMSIPVDRLSEYIDCCIPAGTARPYVEKGLTGDQAIPYMRYKVPPETARYFAQLGIPGDLCGPYYAAGASVEDTVAYLDSGFTADQIMPYVSARVPQSDATTYLNAGATYDRAKPYINAGAPADASAPFAASQFPADHCLPFINAGVSFSKARSFLLFGIPADQAAVYILNNISATAAKPYVDAGVPAEKAVDEIKQGIPPAK